jgi:PmbA protein
LLHSHAAHATTLENPTGVEYGLDPYWIVPEIMMALAPTHSLRPTREDLKSIIERALEEARSRGASQAEAAVSQNSGLSVGVRLGEVETLEHQRDRSMGITVYFGQRKGSASTADFSPEAVEATVAKACSIARFTAEDSYAGLADASLMARSQPDLDLDHPWELSAERAIEIAKSCESAALKFDALINNSEGASVNTHQGLHVYGNTHGFVGGYPTTSHTVSCVVLAGTGEDMQRDYWYSTSRDWRDLEDEEAIGRESARRTIARLAPRKLTTRRARVLFAPETARGLIGHFSAAIRGSSQYRQSSFLLNAAGQQIFPKGFSIAERPHIPKAMGSAPFDEEGVATRDRELVSDGVLTGYILSSYSARRLGLATSGNAGGAHNLVVAPNTAGGLQAMLERLGDGLLVTELMGQGVNAVTGDYSRGATGFWVERGAVQYPVAEITIAGNLRGMLMDIEAVGDDVDARGGIRVGSILLKEMTIAGE